MCGLRANLIFLFCITFIPRFLNYPTKKAAALQALLGMSAGLGGWPQRTSGGTVHLQLEIKINSSCYGIWSAFLMSPKFFVLGFINLGASTKRQIANFQFVAPLMAFFNPSLNDTSTVHYFGDGEYLSTHISLIFFESRLLDLTTLFCSKSKLYVSLVCATKLEKPKHQLPWTYDRKTNQFKPVLYITYIAIYYSISDTSELVNYAVKSVAWLQRTYAFLFIHTCIARISSAEFVESCGTQFQ